MNDRLAASWALVVGSIALGFWFWSLPPARRKALLGREDDQHGGQGAGAGNRPARGPADALRDTLRQSRANETEARRQRDTLGAGAGVLRGMDSLFREADRIRQRLFEGGTPGINPNAPRYFDPEAELSRGMGN